jgi:hypothetical protein
LPFLWIASGLNVGVEIDFINTGLSSRAWPGVPRLSVAQLDMAELLHIEATPHSLALWR